MQIPNRPGGPISSKTDVLDFTRTRRIYYSYPNIRRLSFPDGFHLSPTDWRSVITDSARSTPLILSFSARTRRLHRPQTYEEHVFYAEIRSPFTITTCTIYNTPLTTTIGVMSIVYRKMLPATTILSGRICAIRVGPNNYYYRNRSDLFYTAQ